MQDARPELPPNSSQLKDDTFAIPADCISYAFVRLGSAWQKGRSYKALKTC